MRKEFLVTAGYGNSLQPVIRDCEVGDRNEFDSIRLVTDKVWAWAKQKYGILPGDIVKDQQRQTLYGLGWTQFQSIATSGMDWATGGFQVHVELVKPVQKQHVSTTPTCTTKGVNGNAVGEGLAIQRRKELNILVQEKNDRDEVETVTVDDIFGKRPKNYRKPLPPTAHGLSFSKEQNQSNSVQRRRNNGQNGNFDLPDSLSVEMFMETFDWDTFTVTKGLEPFHLVEFTDSYSRIVETGKAVEQMKFAAKMLAKTTERQYGLVQGGKLIWTTE